MDINFNKPYLREDYLNFFQTQLLPEDFIIDEEKVDVDFKAKYIINATFLGKSDSLNLNIYEVSHTSLFDARVGLSREIFKLMSRYGIDKSLVLFVPPDKKTYRLSLVTIDPKLDDKGVKVLYEYSNPRRYSFLLGQEAKINTPYQFLVKKGRIKDNEDLKSRFSVEVVNKEFYNQIALLFTKLVGGQRKVGNTSKEFQGILKMPSDHNDQMNKEFAVRLIGRIIFCWFLKKKNSRNGIPLIPDDILSLEKIEKGRNFYHYVLEPLFFETLNTPLKERNNLFRSELYDLVPFLNGGLFEPQNHDYYKLSSSGVSEYINTLTISNEWFHELLTLLELYNFTIDENTSVDVDLSVDPEMLGRIFENLLAEINPLTGDTARKLTGSYYTPRPIVEYMVDQSIKHFLKNKTNIDDSILENLLDYSQEDINITNSEKNQIIESLDKLKILDPGCGSGAFPIGVLQKIILILQKVDPDSKIWLEKILNDVRDPEVRKVLELKLRDDSELTDYTRKLGIIRKSIYGVDIQPVAADLSKLRCFLSLIVDEKIDDEVSNRGIHPLPNLEFKFVCANTLIPLPEIKGQIDLFEDVGNLDKLKELRGRYFASYGNEKDCIIQDFKKVQKEMFVRQIDDHEIWKNKDFIESQTLKLTNWEPFSNESSDWFDPKWMFGIDEGFDIIIGNPPYVGQKGNKELFEPMKNDLNLEKKMDYWYFFLHRAYQLSNIYGITSFITPNYWITAKGAKKVRSRIVNEYSVLEYINFNKNAIFEAGIHTNIFILQKSDIPNDTIQCTYYENVYEKEILEHRDKELNFSVDQKEIFSDWTGFVHFLPNDIMKLINKLCKGCEKLSDNETRGSIKQGMVAGKTITDGICNINQGIITGKDRYKEKSRSINEGVYILSDDEVESLNLTSDELSYVKKFHKNSNIRQFFINNDINLNILYVDRVETPEDFNKLKNISRHLESYKSILMKRYINGVLQSAYKKGKWWAMIHTVPFDIIKNPKIVCPHRSYTNSFAFYENEFYAASDVFYISSNKDEYSLKYITSILNSKLIYYWLFWMGKRKGDILELTFEPLQFIPIKDVTSDKQQVFIDLHDKIMSINEAGDSGELLQQAIRDLNLKIFKLYDLDYNDIKTIDPEFQISEKEYESVNIL
jgi:adenine-specific DNA-methyltransferase